MLRSLAVAEADELLVANPLMLPVLGRSVAMLAEKFFVSRNPSSRASTTATAVRGWSAVQSMFQSHCVCANSRTLAPEAVRASGDDFADSGRDKPVLDVL